MQLVDMILNDTQLMTGRAEWKTFEKICASVEANPCTNGIWKYAAFDQKVEVFLQKAAPPMKPTALLVGIWITTTVTTTFTITITIIIIITIRDVAQLKPSALLVGIWSAALPLDPCAGVPAATGAALHAHFEFLYIFNLDLPLGYVRNTK